MDKNLEITPKTRVGEMLDRYPELEETLIRLAPAFKKLKNPVLRKTVGKVATLQQAASVGNVPLEKLINTLREEAGQELTEVHISSEDAGESKPPKWFDPELVEHTFDARDMLTQGENPMATIFKEIDKTPGGKIFKLTTPFLPKPIIDKLEDKGYVSHTVQPDPGVFENYFMKAFLA